MKIVTDGYALSTWPARVAAAVMAGALLFGVAGASQADPQDGAGDGPAEWSEAKAAKLVGDLVAALDAVLADPGVAPQQDSVVLQRKHQAAIAAVKRMRRVAGELHRRLLDGEGRPATVPLVDEIVSIREEVQVFAEDSWVTPAAAEKAGMARVRLAGVRGYYNLTAP